MNYLKEMNQTNTGFEVIYYDKNLIYYTNLYNTEDEALEFISTLNMTGEIPE
tara:strand:- start:68 stop:223 length:156 start_codon:yes stop_codon:yes gene_type:complete